MRFAPLAQDDLPLLHRWLNAPHVVAGYSRVPTTAEEIAAKYGPRIAGSEPVRGYVASVDGKPIGYVQVYRVADFPAYLAAVGDAGDDAAIDVLIGEIEYTGAGSAGGSSPRPSTRSCGRCSARGAATPVPGTTTSRRSARS